MSGARAIRLGVVLVCGFLMSMAASRAPAFACGIGVDTPTMVANGVPALAFPASTTLPPEAPIGIFMGSYDTGKPILFTEDISAMVSLQSKDDVQWLWNFGDRSSESVLQSPAHAFNAPGAYDVRVEIKDPSSTVWTVFDSAEIRVADGMKESPKASFFAPDSVVVGQTLTFDARGSRASDGSPLTYTWNFDDGAEAQGVHVTHQFSNLGKGIVALTVTDAHGAVGVAMHPLIIVPELPVAAVTQQSWVAMEGLNATFDASHSAPPNHPPGDTLTGFIWDFGDGSPPTMSTGPLVSHRFRTSGRHTVIVRAIEGAAGATGTTTLRVTVLAWWQALALGVMLTAMLLGSVLLSWRRLRHGRKVAV